MDNPDLCMGFVLGFVVAGALGFVLQRIRLANLRIQQAGTKQKIVGETQFTPREAVRQSAAAQLEILFWVVLFVGFLGLLVWVLLR